MDFNQRQLATFFLSLFIALKIVGFHVIGHTDDEALTNVNCELCEDLIIAEYTPLISSNEQYTFKNNTSFAQEERIVRFIVTIQNKKISVSKLFCRPPPTVV